jgi:hypothetical protein
MPFAFTKRVSPKPYTCRTLVTRSIGVSKERKIFVGLF